MTPCWLHWTTAFPHADDPQNGLFVAHGLEAVPGVDHRVLHIKADQMPGTAPLPAGPAQLRSAAGSTSTSTWCTLSGTLSFPLRSTHVGR